MSFPRAAADLVGSQAADHDVVPGLAVQHVVAVAADQHVVAIAAVGGVADRGGGETGGDRHVIAREGFDEQPVIRRLGVLDPDERGESGNRGQSVLSLAEDHVVAVRAVDGDRVGRPVAGHPADRGREIGLDLDHVCAGEIVDDDVVGTAEGLEEDLLRVVDVHRDARDVAEEPQTRTVRGDIDVLRDTGAVEEQRVEVSLPLDDVAAVARIPAERVVAAAEEGSVVAAVAVDEVVLGAAEQLIVAVAAADRVVPGAAVCGQVGQRCQPVAAGDGVVAAQCLDEQLLRRDQVDRRARRRARHADVSGDSGRCDRDRLGRGRAIHRDAVRAVEWVDEHLVECRLAVGHPDLRGQAGHAHRGAVLIDLDLVVRSRPLDRDRIRLAVTGVAGESGREVGLHAVEVGAARRR